MELKELYHMIQLQPEIVKKLDSIENCIPKSNLDFYLEQLMDIKSAPKSYQTLKDNLQEDTDNLKMLYCQLECAKRVYTKYQEKHIPEIVFIDTMKCFSRFLTECEKKNGHMFFDRGWWTYRQISMNLFRIGTLEYEFAEHEQENAIGIHIPSDADLSKEAVDQSLKQAKEFLQTYYPNVKYSYFTCHSWLLSPSLEPLLSSRSHILAFQKRFHILRTDPNEKEFIQWLFQVPADTDYEQLPAATHLQRDVKNLLLTGKTIGSAYGIMNSP